ncbi:Protein CBG27720 [Caenorhabditis briggsae]|uniref:Protein CBG27720 n=1 Tax=Caenorhabditis briggsae TaxID=6238 RepID=B6IJ18_CAEBR|nr:Protein CBG27720 [Caenorhabditis briggsae]CAR99998.1 Protein CBG27720 [Caenorhabditis briggsae]
MVGDVTIVIILQSGSGGSSQSGSASSKVLRTRTRTNSFGESDMLFFLLQNGRLRRSEERLKKLRKVQEGKEKEKEQRLNPIPITEHD